MATYASLRYDFGTQLTGEIPTAAIADNAVTLAKMAGGTDGNLIGFDASGDPAAIATGTAGQVLTSGGANVASAMADAAGGGITAASQWRINTSYSGEADPIITYWEEVDAPVGLGILGSSMTESNGRFTFPSTGYWHIDFRVTIAINNPNTSRYCTGGIKTTIDDSTYALAARGFAGVENWLSSTGYNHLTSDYIFDVTSTANCKCSFDFMHGGNTNVVNCGTTDYNRINANFIRLGDT